MGNYLKKFKTKSSAIVIGAIIDVVILILYIICLQILKSNSENINIYATVALDIISNRPFNFNNLSYFHPLY